MSDRLRNYTWYVEPLDDSTNEYLSRVLPEECAHVGKECTDGRHDLWESDRGFQLVSSLKNSVNPLRYRIYVQEGAGEIRLYVKPKRKPPNYPKKMSKKTRS